ncbi:hypothetical protein [Ornithinimicrobium sp. INDO-MA30-4]|uniref:hypothetical protein n=1 Tax=Ornithinimicrobium sp. INDO-MA30-4 TaxID=2908651 RepID=UPI001F433DBA|nr:hypothetical protein [Ornithinimicrobium sp. INDO-MA30-4]UJH69365.1 hypothetical protein L0A91_07940 [Ornithinimicrobium sp. INDO-MA30-4]
MSHDLKTDTEPTEPDAKGEQELAESDPVLTDQQWGLVLEARVDYAEAVAPAYDEVFEVVAAQAVAVGSLGKADIAALVFWKRATTKTEWVIGLLATPEADVRAVTARALTLVNDPALSTAEAADQAREVLADLPGLDKGDALISAVLAAAAPARMANFSRQTQAGLKKVGISVGTGEAVYRRYMESVDSIVALARTHGHPWTSGDVAVALHQLGRTKK